MPCASCSLVRSNVYVLKVFMSNKYIDDSPILHNEAQFYIAKRYLPEAKHQNIVIKCNVKRYTGSFVSTRKCVNLVTHTNFTVVYTCYRSRLLINKFNARGSGYVLERRFTKFTEITQCNGHYAVQGHSRSPIFVSVESSYTTSY